MSVFLPATVHAESPLEKFAPDFSTNTSIIWQASTTNLPASLWIYQRLPARTFSAAVLSNAITMASLRYLGIPRPSTNVFFIWSDPNPCGMAFSIFSVLPAKREIAYSSPDPSHSTDDLPNDETVKKRAYDFASQLGLDARRLIPHNFFYSSNAPDCDGKTTNGYCGRGIVLSRELDGVTFFSNGGVDEADGFAVDFGSHGQVRAFCLVWPDLERSRDCKTASPREIINCLRGRRIMVLPNPDEETYFQRIKYLTQAKTFTITKMTPRYGEGILGEMLTNDAPAKFIIPFAEIEAVANFGSSNVTVKLISPVLSSEATRLLGEN